MTCWDECKSCMTYDRFIKTLRICGGLAGCALLAAALITIFTGAGVTLLNPRVIINIIYQIVFGVLMVVCELRWRFFLRYFGFLTHFFGLGMFYIFVGGLALGSEWWQYLIGGYVIGVGTIYLIIGLFNKSMDKETAERERKEEEEAKKKKGGVSVQLNATGNAAIDRHIDEAASSHINNEIDKKKKELNPWDIDDNPRRASQSAAAANPFDEM